MNNKKMIVIPALYKFESKLGIRGRKIKAAAFIPNKSNYQNLSLLELSLYQLKFLDIVGWFTNEKGFQSGEHRLKKLHDLNRKNEIDMIICYSSEDLLDYESHLENNEIRLENNCSTIYCIQDCTIIKSLVRCSLQ